MGIGRRFVTVIAFCSVMSASHTSAATEQRTEEKAKQKQPPSAASPTDTQRSKAQIAETLKALLTCNVNTVRVGEPVVAELFLQNTSTEQITYYDLKKCDPPNDILDSSVITLMVDGKPVGGYTTLDVADAGYKVVAKRGGDHNTVHTDSVVSYSRPPIPREAFVVLKPGEKVAYLKVDLQPAWFKDETSKQALGPMQIPGEHMIQVEYVNGMDGKRFGLNAWTGAVKSNVVTVNVEKSRSPDEVSLEIENLLNKLGNLEKEHLKTRRDKWEAMGEKNKQKIMSSNMSISSGLEDSLNMLVRETEIRIAALGEPAVPLLMEKLRSFWPEIHYQRLCVTQSLREIGRLAVPYLLEALQGPGIDDKLADARYRNHIITTLGDIKDTRAVPALLVLLHQSGTSSIPYTSTIAAALARIGDERAVEPIIAELDIRIARARKKKDWDDSAMISCARALGSLGDIRAVPVLRQTLTAGPQTTKGGREYLLAEAAAKALRSMGRGVQETRGVVISPRGKRLVNAEVRINRSETEVRHSNNNGEFCVYGHCWLLEARHDEWPGYKAMMAPEYSEDLTVLVFRRSQNFKGKIVDRGSSKPISGARITLEAYVGAHTASGFGKVEGMVSGGDGSFVLEDLVPENRYRLIVYSRGYGRVVTDWFSARGNAIRTKDNHVMPKNIRLYPGREVTFTILGPKGEPAPNMLIQVGGKDWPYGQGRTDDRGKVTIADIPQARQLLKQHRQRQIHVYVGTRRQWRQQKYWYEPDTANEVTIRLGTGATSGVGRSDDPVADIVNRLFATVEKAYAEAGLSRQDVQRLFETQAPPQKLMGKWKAYQESWPAIVKAREAAIKQIVLLGPGAVPAMLEATDRSDERRGGDIFVSAIVRIAKPAGPALINGLSHENATVRARAATSLGKIQDKRAVEPLINTLRDPDRGVLSAAVRALGFLKDQRAVEPLLRHWKKDVIRRSELAWALGHIGDRRATIPIMDALEECISQAQKTGNWDANSWDMRMYAGALGQIGDPQAVSLLKRLLYAGPQRTKSPKRQYHLAEAAARALRSLGVEVTGDIEKGNYQIVQVSPQEPVRKTLGPKDVRHDTPKPVGTPQRRDYVAALSVPQPLELWRTKRYGCGGNPRTQQHLSTDVKRRYPVSLTWPLIQDAGKYIVQIEGVRGSQPATSFESLNNCLHLGEPDIAPGRYQWSVSVYEDCGRFMGNIETIDPVEVFAIDDPQPVAANGKKVLIDLNHSAGHVRGWGYYNHAQYMTKELLECAGFEVELNERDLLTTEKLESVDLLICNYYWTRWPDFRDYLDTEISAVREFVDKGGSLLVVGCDRKDGGNGMSTAGNELTSVFGLTFELGEMGSRNGTALADEEQSIISFRKPIPVQLPVGIVGQADNTLLRFEGVPIAKAGQFGNGRLVVAGTGMSFLDCYLGDFQNREPLHLILFYDVIRYLTSVDWHKSCRREFVERVLSRCLENRTAR